jgi:hypothetical protein
MSLSYVHLDPLLPPAEADAMLQVAERFGRFPTYGAEAAPEERGKTRFAPGIPQRYDAALNFLRTGGRFGRHEDTAALAGRTNYLRATYHYEKPAVEGVEGFLHYEAFLEAARRVHGRPRVVPSIVYANLLLPGQELALHTDVPEFRGANRTELPQWLLVVMHHSGLFAEHRRHIATGVAYFGESAGGAFAFHPDGPHAPAATIPARHNTAVVLDTDSVFHGVDRVGLGAGAAPPFRPGMELVFEGDGAWRLVDGAETLARYRFGDLRYSVSWKAYCYADETEQFRTERHEDDLELDAILERLSADLRRRGRLPAGAPAARDGDPAAQDAFGRFLIETYVHFPRAAARA